MVEQVGAFRVSGTPDGNGPEDQSGMDRHGLSPHFEHLNRFRTSGTAIVSGR